MYLHFVPSFVRLLFPHFSWRRNENGRKVIYLTFDDGPVTKVTPFVLQTLKEYSAKATFFCVGDNIRKQPELFQQLLQEGHQVGNHTFHHLNGLKSAIPSYLEDVEKCSNIIQQYAEPFVEEGRLPLFRPPYGRIKREQAKKLLDHYQIVMWDVLTADFDTQLQPEDCLRKSIRYSRSGSIVVFHDNPKAYRNLSWVLPRYLAYFSEKGYTFESL